MRVSKFLKDLISTGASQVGVLLFGVLLLKIMTAVLNEENFGLFILIRRWIVVLLPMVTLNLSIGLARYISFDKEKARFYLHISLIITTALTVLMFIFLILFNKTFSITFFKSPHYSKLVFLLALFLFAHVIHLITYSYFRGKMDMNTANVMRLLFTGFPVLLAGIFFILGTSNYSTILYLYFSVYAFWGVISSLYFLRKVCSFTLFKTGVALSKTKLVFNFKESRSLLLYSLARIPSLFFISLILSFPVFIATHKISVTAAGYIGIVVAVLHLLGIFCMPFNLILLPKFSSLTKNKQVENIKNYSLVILDFIITFLPIIVVMLFGLTRYIILIWFGPKYLITVNSAAIAILASVFYLGYALIRGVLDGLFEFPFINIINLAGLVTVVVLCLLIGTGIFELSAALSCGLFILGVASIFVLVKKLQLPVSWLKALKALVGCGLIFLLLTVADDMITGLNLSTWYTFAICAFYRIFLLVLVWWFYWRKTLWYNEMLKRITFKDSIKEDVMMYEE
ncbi:MAG: oligosaccharide flippase family protein [Candidatus Aminicenantes bacterium]|nr:MAG: oligosaccharide flippase family protein [Candidatus Aminicenantes bacterium]